MYMTVFNTVCIVKFEKGGYNRELNRGCDEDSLNKGLLAITPSSILLVVVFDKI